MARAQHQWAKEKHEMLKQKHQEVMYHYKIQSNIKYYIHCITLHYIIQSHFQEQVRAREEFLMKRFEHHQKVQLERTEHLLRLQLYSQQIAYYRVSSVNSTTSTSVQTVQSQESRVQDDSPVSPKSAEATGQSPASG